MNHKLRFSFSLFVILLTSLNTARADEQRPAFHFVVTGGLMGIADGSRAFFNSPLFRLKTTSKTGDKFVITDANTRAYRFRNTLILPKQPINHTQLSGASAVSASGVVRGFMGAQLFALGAAKGSLAPQDLKVEDLTRELGSIPVSMKWEIRVVDGVEVLAVRSTLSPGNVEWPSKGDQVDDVLAVRGRFEFEKDAREYLFFPRQVASTDRVFGTVDKLLASDPLAQYIDLGDTLFGPDVEDIDLARKLQTIILKRNPAVLGAGWHDFRAFWLDAHLMQKAPYVAAIAGKDIVPSISRAENYNGFETIFASLPTSSPLLEMVLPIDAKVLAFDAAVEAANAAARKTRNAFVVGLAQDSQSATKAIESPVFDAVLSLVSAKGGALPSFDEIDLSENKKRGMRSVAPLIRVSSVDVTEVIGHVDSSGALTKLIIKRHAVVDDGPVASDAAKLLEEYESENDLLKPGLPARASLPGQIEAYSEAEYNAILGGILKDLQAKTELAIVERHDPVTPIESPIVMRLSESLLNDRGRAVWLSIRGKYLKRIFKAIKSGQFEVDVSVIGGSYRDSTIGQREISEAEDYRVVVSEKAFFAIYDFMSRESLTAMKNLPAGSLQIAMMEGGKDTLKILSEIRKRDSRDQTSIGESRALFAASMPIADLIDERFEKGFSAGDIASMLANAAGRPARTLVLEIADLDFGLKLNANNKTLNAWQTEALNPTANFGFPDSRFYEQDQSNKLVYAKAALKYWGILFDSELVGSIKFFQPNTEREPLDDDGKPRPFKPSDIRGIRPQKDSVKLEGEIRLPLRRVFNEPPMEAWDPAVLARLTYETQIWPNKWLTDLPEKFWPYRVNDLRLLLGMSISDTIRAGAVFDYDFSRSSPSQAFGYGLELSGQGKWNVGFLTFKIEPTLRQMFPIASPEATRMGLIGLVDAKVEAPIYGGFSLSLLTNATLGTRMNEPFNLGYGVLFAFALSYSDSIKWVLN